MPGTVLPETRQPSWTAPALVGSDIVDLAWLNARVGAWDRLVEEAVSPNPFYSRRIVSAHAAHELAGGALHFAVVYRGERLLALQPFLPNGRRVGLTQRVHAAWISPYVVTSTPLIAAQGLLDNVEALLETLKDIHDGTPWLLPLLSLDSSAGAALRNAIACRGWPVQILSAFKRPVMEAASDAHYEAHLGADRRKDLRRRRRRLGERGRLATRSFDEGDGLKQALEDFLNLEKAGWKGASGTALASHADTAAFARELFSDDVGPVRCRADVLTLDGRPIAVSLAFICGGAAHLFKTAYDENLRRYGPGVLLEDEIIRLRRETGFAERLNSAAMPGSVLDDLYPDRERMGDLLFSTAAASGGSSLAAIATREAWRRRLLARAATLYRGFRSVRGTVRSSHSSH